MRRLFVLALAVVMALCLGTGAALAQGPLESAKTTINKVLGVLGDEALEKNEELRRDKLWQAISLAFDDRDITRRVMAAHWKKINEEQREEIIELFTHLLKKSYLTKLEAYSGEEVVFTKERLDGKYAEVDSYVLMDDEKIPMVYRMTNKKDGRWLIYDLIMDGVSLVGNYKRLFRKTIRKRGYDGLVEALRAKKQQVDTIEGKS